jgi:hypothetical protein
MKTPMPNQQSLHMKHLSPGERKVLHKITRATAGHESRAKRVRALGRKVKHTIVLAACAAGLFAAATTPAHAAVSAPALFNEANAAQRAGRLGPAILDYERARLLAPHDAAIAQNLSAARQKAGVAAAAIPAWQRPAHWLSFNAMTALASISLLLFCLLFFGTRLIPATLRSLTMGIASALGMVAVFTASSLALRWPELDRAVIIGAQPAARIAPATDSAVLFELKPGEIVSAENTYGNFVRIRTANGSIGWVAAAEVEKIIPAAS